MRTKKPHLDRPGVSAPVTAGSAGLRLEAWRDTDNVRARPKYHVAVHMRGRPDIDLFDMTPERIEALGKELLQLHAQLKGGDR